MINKIGLNAKGALEIQKRLKKLNQFLINPKTVTKKKIAKAIKPVTAM